MTFYDISNYKQTDLLSNNSKPNLSKDLEYISIAQLTDDLEYYSRNYLYSYISDRYNLEDESIGKIINAHLEIFYINPRDSHYDRNILTYEFGSKGIWVNNLSDPRITFDNMVFWQEYICEGNTENNIPDRIPLYMIVNWRYQNE